MILSFKRPDGSVAAFRLRTISAARPVTIGREGEADIKVGDAKCSRVHTAIRYWDDIFVVRDMNSRNGTFLNGQKIDVARLSPGDVIKIGDTEILTAADPHSTTDATMAGATPPAAAGPQTHP